MLLGMDDLSVQQSLMRQYQATLAMLKQAIEDCPEHLWLDSQYTNRSWQIAYHSIFFTHLYLHAAEAEFQPWTRHRKGANHLGEQSSASDEAIAAAEPYTRADLLEYLALCCDEVNAKVPAVPLDRESGFSWLPFNRFEVHLYNLRHLAHHTGQLADRLRTVAGLASPWKRTG
jgi:hypothetical protein